MLTVELASLREDAIREHIREQTPEGWVFTVGQSEESRLWESSFRDVKGDLQWEIADITLKQVLLHALGWLEVRKVSLPVGSRWAPRTGDVTNDRVHERAYRATSDDGPSDLEPDEISSVYSSSRRRGK
jgi:hypothetical protein